MIQEFLVQLIADYIDAYDRHEQARQSIKPGRKEAFDRVTLCRLKLRQVIEHARKEGRREGEQEELF